MNSTVNASSAAVCAPAKPDAVEEGMRIFIAVCLSIIITGSFLGNLLVCLAFKVNENLRTVSNYFILNLAISDLITTVFVMPFDLDVIIQRRVWSHGSTMCEFFTSMYLISAPASILNLLAVSIDRYRLISNPFAYERTTTPLRALVVIVAVWVYAIMMALVPIMGWKDNVPNNCPDAGPFCYFQIPLDYSIMISVLHFVIPPLIMTIIYFKIYNIARYHVKRMHRHSVSSVTNARTSIAFSSGMLSPFGNNPEENGHRPSGKRRKSSFSAQPALHKNVKAAKSLAIIIAAFFACWYPLTLTSLVLNACGGLSGDCDVPPLYVFDVLITIGYLNSMLNPFLYALHNKEFKRTYKRIMRYVGIRWTNSE